jgi:hypothetical protein
VADEVLDGTDVMRQFLGEREGLAHQTGHALPERVIEALDVIGFASVLRDGARLCCRNDALIDGILVRMEGGLFTGDPRNIRPEFLATVATPIPHMKRNDLAGGRIHRHPEPLFVGFVLHEAPPLIGFRLQPGQQHLSGLCGELGMQMLGTSRKAFDHKMQEPRETDTHGTADPPERETLTQQLFDPSALLGRNAPVEGIRSKLATARFTLMVLFSIPRSRGLSEHGVFSCEECCIPAHMQG